VSSLKILGVTVIDKLSVSEHVQQVVSRCVQSLHALRILRSHGMEVNNQTTSWLLMEMMHSLDEYWRMNIIYCENCYLAPPATNMDYVAEGITTLWTLKQRAIEISLLGYFTRSCT